MFQPRQSWGMKRYDQDVFHDPENGALGNCFATCIRCILEIDHPIENFVEHDDWYERAQKFLASYNLAYMHPVEIGPTSHLWEYLGYHIISGDGGRGQNGEVVRHAVVGYQGKIVWDPHPSRDGLKGSLDNGWGVGILVFRGDSKIAPSNPRKNDQ